MEPVKFLYAADLRLDRPLALGEGACGMLEPRAGDFAYEATRRLVECALSCGVDFVFLRGELCDACCGAKAFLFLTEQMTRLSRAGIGSYILNEGTPLDARWLARFPPGVKWLPSADADIVSGNRSFSPAALPAPAPLQGLGPEESGPRGALLVTLPDSPQNKEPEKEFIELNALRWERCELDVTSIESEKDLAASWKTVKNGFRGREREPARPVLLHLKLTGVMKERSIFYGEDFLRGPEILMKKLNADEGTRKNFVLADSLSDDTLSPSDPPRAGTLLSDFLEEAAFFKSGIDLRVGLLDALKERGILKHVAAAGATPFIENMTDADVESLLKESCDMANHWFFKDAEGLK